MSRPKCKLCKRNNCRSKGRRPDGTLKLDSICGSCHGRKLKGLDGPAHYRPRYDDVMHLVRFRRYRQYLQKQVDELAHKYLDALESLDQVKAEYFQIRKKVRRYKDKQKARKQGKLKYHGVARRYKQHKGTQCELCGFVAEDPSQLDVDHKDGNGLNNDLSNLWTLCANCHRLKTVREGDHLTPRTPTNGRGRQKDLFLTGAGSEEAGT